VHCDTFSTTYNSNYLRHVRTVHGKNVDGFRCQRCTFR
jgi:hypothetical protein